MQGVTSPKAPSPPLPAGVSARPRPVPGQYLWRGLTTAATTAPSAGKGPPGHRALWNGSGG